MSYNRRLFLKTASLASLGGITLHSCYSSKSNKNQFADYSRLDAILRKPVLKKEIFSHPVLIESLELLRYENSFLCRVRSKEGAEGISVGHNKHLPAIWPIFNVWLQPFFIGKDAREIESLFDELYVHKSIYKLQGIALWIPWATLEFAILDMLGKISKKPIGELIGTIYNSKISVYQANNNRGESAEVSLERIKESVQNSGSKALKFKVGGRMSNNADYPSGRTEKLIPMVREAFGDAMTIYADSNGSYDIEEAIRIGRILEEYKIAFFEEPVPFDWYEETKQVKQGLNIPIAGGEQEPSMRNFRWLIGNRALDIVQPDMFYFGGMIRSMKVARMAEVMGMECTPHISGIGLGFVYMMHFVSALPNAGPFHEFKSVDNRIPLKCDTSSLKNEGGLILVPTGSGLGIEIDPEFVAKHKLLSV